MANRTLSGILTAEEGRGGGGGEGREVVAKEGGGGRGEGNLEQ